MGNFTPRVKRFIQLYPKSLNATKAAEDAGYSKKSAFVQGSRLLSNAKVHEAIKALLDERSEKTKITSEYVLTNLKEVVERCMQRSPVMVFDRAEKEMVQKVDDDGRDVWEFDSAGANRALELIGKHLGMFTDRHDITLRQPEPIEYVPAKKTNRGN